MLKSRGTRPRRAGIELKDLTADERIALVALLEMVVESATILTEGDVDQVRDIIAQVGEQPYQDAVADVDRGSARSISLARCLLEWNASSGF